MPVICSGSLAPRAVWPVVSNPGVAVAAPTYSIALVSEGGGSLSHAMMRCLILPDTSIMAVFRSLSHKVSCCFLSQSYKKTYWHFQSMHLICGAVKCFCPVCKQVMVVGSILVRWYVQKTGLMLAPSIPCLRVAKTDAQGV